MRYNSAVLAIALAVLFIFCSLHSYAASKPGEKFTVVIDAGHGGKDSVTRANGFLEKEIVLSIALEIQKQLTERGIRVVMTRSSDIFIPLSERARVKGDVFISLHTNSVPDRIGPSVRSMIKGVEIYTETQMNTATLLKRSKLLANAVHASLGLVEGMVVRGPVKQCSLAVLRENVSPAILVELGYLTNIEDAGFLSNYNCYSELAKAFCDGIETYRNSF